MQVAEAVFPIWYTIEINQYDNAKDRCIHTSQRTSSQHFQTSCLPFFDRAHLVATDWFSHNQSNSLLALNTLSSIVKGSSAKVSKVVEGQMHLHPWIFDVGGDIYADQMSLDRTVLDDRRYRNIEIPIPDRPYWLKKFSMHYTWPSKSNTKQFLIFLSFD